MLGRFFIAPRLICPSLLCASSIELLVLILELEELLLELLVLLLESKLINSSSRIESYSSLRIESYSIKSIIEPSCSIESKIESYSSIVLNIVRLLLLLSILL